MPPQQQSRRSYNDAGMFDMHSNGMMAAQAAWWHKSQGKWMSPISWPSYKEDVSQ